MVFEAGEVGVRRPAWLFRKFRVGLRTEIIFNLALLMTGALLLVGFGIIKIHERDILNQKVKNGKMIVKSLEEHDWNQTRTAKALGISRDNLRYRLRKYQIKRPTN